MPGHTRADVVIEVRLFGAMQVRRSDGTPVADHEWRTRKARDLLRILALEAGRPVASDQLMDKLWPHSDNVRARGSLRTAASHLRRTVGPDCLLRSPDGLALTGAWVDVVEFDSFVEEVRRAKRAGQHDRVVALAHSAETLVTGELHAACDGATWVSEARDQVRAARLSMLLDAAEAAVELRWFDDTVDLARRAAALQPASERACRALMQAHAGLGEVGAALRTYHDLRADLADEHGSDPSAQTQAMYLQVLAASREPRSDTTEIIGRDEQLAALTGALTTGGRSGLGLVLLHGPENSGRRAIAAAALDRTGLAGQPLDLDSDDRPDPDSIAAALRQAGDHVVTTASLGTACPVRAGALADALAAVGPRFRARLVVSITAEAAPVLLQLLEEAPGLPAPVMIDVPRLDLRQLTELAEHTLSGTVSDRLVEELARASGGLAGEASRVLQSWAHSGSFVWTTRGLMPTTDHVTTGAQATVSDDAVLEGLDQEDLELVGLLKLLGKPVGETTLQQLLGSPPHHPSALTHRLDHLAQARVLTRTPAGFRLHARVHAVEVEGWLPPDARARHHRRIAEQMDLPLLKRSWHWLAAGDVMRACAPSLEAARDARTPAEKAQVRSQLKVLRRLTTSAELCDAGRREAQRLVEEGFTLLNSPAHPLTARPTRSTADDFQVGRMVVPGTGAAPDDLEPVLLNVLSHADRSSSAEEMAEARLRLCEQIALQRRRPTMARRLAEEAIALAETATQRATALYLQALCDVVLGSSAHASRALADLEEARFLAEQDGADLLRSGVRGLQALVMHRFNKPGLADVMLELEGCEPRSLHPMAVTSAMRIHVERFERSMARLLSDSAPLDVTASPVTVQARMLAEAALLEAEGRPEESVATLRDCLELSLVSSCSVQLPEVLLRLIRLEGPTNPDAASSAWELYERSVLETPPTALEQSQRLLALAAMRATPSTPRQGVVAANAAAQIAEDDDLVVAAGHAHLACADYLTRCGDDEQMRVSLAASARCFDEARVQFMASRLAMMTRGLQLGRPLGPYSERRATATVTATRIPTQRREQAVTH